jgi:hypothetical protein
MGRLWGGVVGAIVLLGVSAAWAETQYPSAFGVQASLAQAYSEVPQAGNSQVDPRANVAGEAEWMEMRDAERASSLRIVTFVAGSELVLALIVAAACWLVLTLIGTWVDDGNESDREPAAAVVSAAPRPEACVLLEPRVIRRSGLVRRGADKIPIELLAVVPSLHVRPQ